MNLELSAPAKLNLFLHIVGRRTDGYHELQSVFVLIDLCDTIRFTPNQNGQIIRSGDIIGAPEKDLCVRAAKLLQQKTNTSFGVEINVTKRIPAGAGLGGGSSDAATTLMALNHLWDLKLSRDTLIEMATQLGADVPFFLLGTNAWVEGIGEKLTPISIPELSFAVIWPGVGQNTGEIFSHPDLTRNTKYVTMSILDAARSSGDWMGLGHNDLEPIAKIVNPEVKKLLTTLPQFRLTGSGSAAFALMPESEAKRVFENLPTKWKHFSVKSLKIHPTLSALSC